MKKKVRKEFRDAVFKRDRYTCRVCGKTRSEEFLDAHHITDRNEMPKGGYVLSNGITVCKEKCHELVETWHSSGNMVWANGYHPIDLYRMINSSKEQAVKDSEK